MRFFEISHEPANNSWHLLCNGKIYRDLPPSPNGVAHVDIAAMMQSTRDDPDDSILDHAGRPGLDACNRVMELLSDCEAHLLTDVDDVMFATDVPTSKSYATRLLNAMYLDGHVMFIRRTGIKDGPFEGAVAGAMLTATRRGAMSLAESQCTRHVRDDEAPSRAHVIEAARRQVLEVLADGKYHHVRSLVNLVAGNRADEAVRKQIHAMADRGEIRRKRGAGNSRGGHRGVAWFARLDVDDEGIPKSATMRAIEMLDELAVPPDATKRTAASTMRSNGVKVTDATLLEAQRFRRRRADVSVQPTNVVVDLDDEL